MLFIRGILDRIILVTGIIVAGCIPSFIAQYRQRVGGRLDQALQDIAPFQEIANLFHHGSLQELIQHHLASADATFHKEGAALQAMVDSVAELTATWQALNTDLIHQLAFLLTSTDVDIARSTWEIFSPSFTLTINSVVFACVVGVLMWLLFISIWTIFARMINLFTTKYLKKPVT